MRILAIRGENLASLRKFDLDLDDPDALGAVGLFAITGPTGAGKSTLLDALCLALYDKTPRFDSSRSGHRVGREPDDPTNLGATDVRNILRRGAGAGHAEVDFVGRDGGSYQARWSVHRARNRPGNRMQSQSMKLTDLLDGQPLEGATKSETLAKIEDLTGLSFDQFRRSVLLAQGDFDAFLRAPVKERGALLERMTGTDIYRRLSVAAHERHRDARATLQRLDDRLTAHPVISPGQRTRLIAHLANGEAWTTAAQTRESEAEDGVRWHEQHAALDAAVAAAKASHAGARMANAGAADARVHWEQVRQAQPIKPLADAAARADADATRHAHQAQVAQDAAQQAERDAAALTAQVDAAKTRHADARAAEVAAAGDLRTARALDAKVDAAQAASAHADAEAARVRLELQTRIQALEALAATRAAAQETARTSANALAKNAALTELLPRWSELSAGAARWQAARTAVAASQAQTDAAEADVQALSTALSAAHAQRDEAQARLATADATVEQAEVALKQIDGGKVHAARQRHADAARNLEQLRDLSDQAARLRRSMADADRRVAEAQAERRPTRTTLTKAEKRATQARSALALARKALNLSRAASAVADHRAHLVEGEPCPVCGATEHPGIDPTLIATSEFQAQVDTLEADLDAADDRAENARVALATINATLESESRARARLTTDEQALLSSWSMLRMQIGGAVPDRPDADAAVEIKTQLAQARASRDAADAQAKVATAHVERRDAALSARSGAQAMVAQAQRVVDSAAQALITARQTLADHRATTAQAVAVASQADGQISALISLIGRAAFEADAPGELATLQARIKQHQSDLGTQAAALATVTESEPQWLQLQAQTQELQSQVKRLDEHCATSRAHWQAEQAQRRAIFDGDAADAVAERLAALVRSSEALLESARTALATAAQTAARAQAASTAASTALGEAQTARAEAQARLTQACAAVDLDLQRVAALTRHDAAWIKAESDRLGDLTAAIARADAVFRERSADLARHVAAPTSVPDLAQARALLSQAAAQRRDFERALMAAEAKLAVDDAARKARVETEVSRVEAEAERQLWGQLDVLIGSADGAAFREFAQSLTLDAVIARANYHLKTLAKRYALMRVPGENLALQVVDRHMGDEVRTVKSLSGGETFLVSLSLALGLASLSARDTRIDSLFIDEGFGTLDTDTLDVVLDALDALQAGGRQIGLISHVPGLAQRIGVQVLVEPTASGLSAVTVSAGWRGSVDG